MRHWRTLLSSSQSVPKCSLLFSGASVALTSPPYSPPCCPLLPAQPQTTHTQAPACRPEGVSLGVSTLAPSKAKVSCTTLEGCGSGVLTSLQRRSMHVPVAFELLCDERS